MRSISRSRRGESMTTNQFVLGLQMNMQIKCIFALIMIYSAAEIYNALN